MSVENGGKRVYNDGYVKGHNDGWRGAVKAYSFGKPDEEVVDKLDKKYEEGYNKGYNKGYTQCIEDNSQRNKSEFVEVRQHHYDMGYNDALAYLASEEAEKELELKKQGYEEGYDGGFEDGFNKAIKEMHNNQALGETTDYEFGTDDCCEHHTPNKETQEAIQEVLDKDSNEFEGVWVYIKDVNFVFEYFSEWRDSVWLKVISMPKDDSFYKVGELVIITKELLESYYSKIETIIHNSNGGDGKEDEQIEKELELVEKYPHYYKDIRHLNIIDIYRFFDLFEVTDPCLQHSMKKLAVGGKRGAKDYKKDIKEAMDTLKRWEYMQEENKRGLDD